MSFFHTGEEERPKVPATKPTRAQTRSPRSTTTLARPQHGFALDLTDASEEDELDMQFIRPTGSVRVASS